MAVDKRNVIFTAIVLEIEGHADITLDISTPESRKRLLENPVRIKEGATYQMKIVFRVRLDVITGLKYLEEKKFRGTLIEKSDTLMVVINGTVQVTLN
jgi:Rho GDP-dissociation inhibitor